MSKRPFDHIENKIREAAENSEPLFNEHAWAKMELLLDKERKKKRFLFWWVTGFSVLFLILGAGGYLLNSPSSTEKKLEASVNSTKAPLAQNSTTPIPAAVTESANTNLPASSPDRKKDLISPAEDDGAEKKSDASTGNFDYKKQPLNSRKDIVIEGIVEEAVSKNPQTTGHQLQSRKKSLHSKGKKLLVKNSTTVKTTVDLSMQDDEEPLSPEPQKAIDAIAFGSINTRDTRNTDAMTDSLFVAIVQKKQLSDSSKMQPTASATKRDKTSSTGSSRFYFIVEGGVEILTTKAFSYKNNEFSGRYGAAVGYELNKRFSVQTGFFAGRKKYTGGPGDYHPKQGTYLSTVNIKKVDASCLIYDIPITVRYNLNTKGKTHWFVTGGLSSFIMKEEDYNYYYTYNSMPYAVHEKPYSYTGNKNLFSVLTVSAGFEKKLLKNTSLLVEPYCSLPLKGVGEGTVKLYSTGLQVGIKYKPTF